MSLAERLLPPRSPAQVTIPVARQRWRALLHPERTAALVARRPTRRGPYRGQRAWCREWRRLAPRAAIRAGLCSSRSKFSNGSPQPGHREHPLLAQPSLEYGILTARRKHAQVQPHTAFYPPDPGGTWLQNRAISALHARNTALCGLCAIAPEVEKRHLSDPKP